MKHIKSILEEELERSRRLQIKYEEALKKEVSGSLVRKKIKGKVYYYLASRKGGKVVFDYLGKLSEDEIKKYERSKQKKAQLRQMIRDLKKQIAYLEKVIR